MNIKTMLGSIVLAGSSLMAVNAQAVIATTPEQAVKSYFSTLEEGDENGFFELIAVPRELANKPAEQLKQAQHRAFVGMQGALKQDGGLKSLDVSQAKARQDSEHMTVHCKVVSGNGQTHEADVPVVKTGNGWKLGQ